MNATGGEIAIDSEWRSIREGWLFAATAKDTGSGEVVACVHGVLATDVHRDLESPDNRHARIAIEHAVMAECRASAVS